MRKIMLRFDDPDLLAAFKRVQAKVGHGSGVATLRALIRQADAAPPSLEPAAAPVDRYAALLDALAALCGPDEAITAAEALRRPPEALDRLRLALAGIGKHLEPRPSAQALGCQFRMLLGCRDGRGRFLAARYNHNHTARWYVAAPLPAPTSPSAA